MIPRDSLHALFAVLVISQAAFAADWPQWRGPQRTGISTEKGLSRQWPTEGPRLLWQAKAIGQGYSTPSVVGERIYVLSNEGLENEFVQALSVKDGQQIWSTRLGKVGNPAQKPPYPAARSTPTVDGELLYALGSDGDLACVVAATGELKWKKSLTTDFGGKYGEWAYSESPLVDGDVVVCTPGGSEATIVALNKATGDVVWKSPVPGGDDAGYSSVIAIEIDGVKQYVQFLAKGLVGVDAKTGKFLWRYEETAKGSPANIPTPIARDRFVYSGAGRSGGGLAKLESKDGAFTAEQVYFDKKLPTAIGGAVLIGDHLYGASGQGFVCAEFATGKIAWQDRSVGAGAVCYADGNLYLHGENGEAALVEATPEAYREKGRFTPPEQPDRGSSRAWAYPVVANGRLYLRDATSLWCYEVSDATAQR